MKLAFKLKTNIRRYINRLLETHRPASYPYISGDGFRSIANFVYDQFLDFNPQSVEHGDIVFVRNNHVADFFENIHLSIQKPYILISHNEDGMIGPEFRDKIDDKILHWYAQNLFFKHPKATALPIGVQNFVVGTETNFIHSFTKIKPESPDNKLTRVLFGFTIGDNHKRRQLDELLSKFILADRISTPRQAYYETLKKYKFIVSPSGGGLDCHRTWEALYFNVIPIVLRNAFTEQLVDLGYPIMLLNNWSELLGMKMEDLADFYEKYKNNFNQPHMYLPYWYEHFIKHR